MTSTKLELKSSVQFIEEIAVRLDQAYLLLLRFGILWLVRLIGIISLYTILTGYFYDINHENTLIRCFSVRLAYYPIIIFILFFFALLKTYATDSHFLAELSEPIHLPVFASLFFLIPNMLIEAQFGGDHGGIIQSSTIHDIPPHFAGVGSSFLNYIFKTNLSITTGPKEIFHLAQTIYISIVLTLFGTIKISPIHFVNRVAKIFHDFLQFILGIFFSVPFILGSHKMVQRIILFSSDHTEMFSLFIIPVVVNIRMLNQGTKKRWTIRVKHSCRELIDFERQIIRLKSNVVWKIDPNNVAQRLFLDWIEGILGDVIEDCNRFSRKLCFKKEEVNGTSIVAINAQIFESTFNSLLNLWEEENDRFQ